MTTILRDILRTATVRAVACIVMLAAAAGAAAEDDQALPSPLGKSEKKEALEAITSGYSEWGSVELNGKLSLDMLPIDPSVKIHMQRSKRLMVSVRAPFVGEVARIEADPDSVTAVYRLKKVYCREPIAGLSERFAVTLSDLQDILLARVFIAGRGTLSARTARYCDIYGADGGGWLVVPRGDLDEELFTYGFSTDADGRETLLAIQALAAGASLMIDYSCRGGRTLLETNLYVDDRNIRASLQLDAPKWGAKAMSPFVPDHNYRRVGLREFVRAVR